MKSFIEELYYGNIDPQNGGFEEDESVQRKLRTISVSEDWLTESCSKKVLNSLIETADYRYVAALLDVSFQTPSSFLSLKSP